MTATSVSISQSGTGVQAKGGSVVARIGFASAATALAIYTFDPGQKPEQSIGFGWGVESVKRGLGLAKMRTLFIMPANAEQGEIGEVTRAGTGPDITVAKVDPDFDGGYDDFDLAVRVSKGGALGVARVDVALDGASFDYNYPLPPEAPGAVIGSVDLTKIDTDAVLHGLTVVAHNETDTTNRTTTFSHPGNASAVVTQLNTVFIANGTHMVASLSQGRFLKIASAIGGTGSHLTIASGTALTALGIAAATYDGAASSVILPGTNAKLTCPSGTYVVDTIYTCPITGPRFAVEDVIDAIDKLLTKYNDTPFAKIEFAQPCADGAELAALNDAVEAKLLDFQSGDFSAFPRVTIAGPLGARGASGIAANDIDVANAMIGHHNDVVTVAHGDAYLEGQFYKGSFRRSPAQHLCCQFSGHSLSEDPGNATFGALDGLQLKSPDYDEAAGTGFLARDENTATTKMGGSLGPGFSVLKNKPDGVYFVRGVTRAGAESLFADEGVVNAAYYCASLVKQFVQSIENTTYNLDPDGYMLAHDRLELEKRGNELLTEFMVRQQHASAAVMTIEHTKMTSGPDLKKVKAHFKFQIRGQAEFVEGFVEAVGTLTFS